MKKILTLAFAFIMLTACSETTTNEYQFEGESDHWKAVYNYKGTEARKKKDGVRTYSNDDRYTFDLVYKGEIEELATMKKLEYSYETFASGGSATLDFTEPPEDVLFSSSGGSGGAIVEERETIKVNVKWDGEEESFILQTKN